MRERVEKLLGPGRRRASGSRPSTRPACASCAARSSGSGRARSFVIYDDGESQALLREALRRHGLDPKGPDARRVHWRIDQWKNVGQGPAAAAAARERSSTTSAPPRSTQTYQGLLAEANALDFGDLLLTDRRALRRAPRGARALPGALAVRAGRRVPGHEPRPVPAREPARRRRTGTSAWSATRTSRSTAGAVPTSATSSTSSATSRTSQVVKLERNYRSTAADPRRRQRGRREQPRPPRARRCAPSAATASRSASTARATSATRRSSSCRASSRARGARAGPTEHFAVFYRTNAQSRPIEEELLKYDVPYVVVGGVRFYDRAEVKDVLALPAARREPRRRRWRCAAS